MKRRMQVLARIFEKLGFSLERFRVEYVSAAEGIKFAALMKEITEQQETLGRKKIKAGNGKLRFTKENCIKKEKIKTS